MPDWKREIRRRLAGLDLPPSREAEIVDELSQHLQDRYDELRRGGAFEADAVRAALVELDAAGPIDLERALERIESRAPAETPSPGEPARGRAFADLAGDVRYALRTLGRSPGFAAVAMLTLALGIGANTALFSIVNAVLLHPLPYPHADELVVLHESKQNFPSGSISYPNFRDWQRDNRTFAAMAIYRSYAFGLTGLGDAERVRAEFVTSDFFPLLGVKPIVGRVFAGKEDDIGAAPIAVVSEGFWTRKLGGAPDVVGRSLTLDGRDYTVVGVVPANADFPAAGIRTCDVYVPIGQWGNPLLTHRTAGLGIHGVGRLKPGVTVAQARADMDDVTRGLAAAYPDANKGIGATVVPFADALVGGVRPILLLLLGAVGFVLLIACVNVANLLLARSLARQREFAVRAALGASRARVVRQMLTESLVLAAAGGGLGLLSAAWGTRAALGSLPATLPRAEYVQVDVRVLLFTLGVSLLSGVVFGLLPALRTSSADLHETLKEGGRGASGARHRTQAVFVVAEFAMALVLLVGAGLMVRTLARLWDVDPGFRPDGVVTFGVKLAPSMATKSPDAIRAAFRDLHDRLAATPNVQAVSLQDGAVPLSDDDEELFWMEGRPRPSSPNDMNWALKYVVEPDYLQAMGLRLERGRFFTNDDRERAPLVVVVDETLARKYFGAADPIGRRLNIDDYDAPAQIVGVVAHVKQWALDRDREQLQAQIYLPFMQMGDRAVAGEASGVGVVLRAAPGPGLFDQLRQTNARMSREQVVFGLQTMNETIADSLSVRRFSMMLFGGFAALALVLAAIGLYGVVSYLVGQRTHEIGVRLALGAQRGDVVRWVLGQGARMAFAGVGIGLVAALGLARVMAQSSLLFGVRAVDPLTFGGVALLLIVVALAACYVPARRATRADPLTALRAE